MCPPYVFAQRLFTLPLAAVLLLVPCAPVHGQSTATLQGRVVDPADSVVPGVEIMLRNRATGVERVAKTDNEGNYQVAALPVGTYSIEVLAQGFQTQIVENLIVEVARTVVQDFQLKIGDLSQEVTVTATPHLVERTTVSVGHVMDRRMVQEIPLNGRYFLDLGLKQGNEVARSADDLVSPWPPPDRCLGLLPCLRAR